MIRGKLIGPTNILLERPIFNPLAESEFAIVPLKEHARELRGIFQDAFAIGFIAGFAIAGIIALVAK